MLSTAESETATWPLLPEADDWLEEDPPAGTERASKYYRARYYDPKIGRFISEDPLWLDGPNRYPYVRNNPTNLVDPDGKNAVALVGGGALAIWFVGCPAYVGSYYEKWVNPYESVDPSQRLKHCVVECEITKNCPGGAFTAKTAGWAREKFGDNDPGDLTAGGQGRDAAQQCPARSCFDVCEERLRRGAFY